MIDVCTRVRLLGSVEAILNAWSVSERHQFLGEALLGHGTSNPIDGLLSWFANIELGMLDMDTASIDEIDRLKGQLERLERRLVRVERGQ